MRRRDFLKSTVAVAAAAELGMVKAHARVPGHNWGNYDFGSGPQVADRLNQGPFPQYAPDAVIPTDEVVMTTNSSEDVVPNYGKGGSHRLPSASVRVHVGGVDSGDEEFATTAPAIDPGRRPGYLGFLVPRSS